MTLIVSSALSMLANLGFYVATGRWWSIVGGVTAAVALWLGIYMRSLGA